MYLLATERCDSNNTKKVPRIIAKKIECCLRIVLWLFMIQIGKYHRKYFTLNGNFYEIACLLIMFLNEKIYSGIINGIKTKIRITCSSNNVTSNLRSLIDTHSARSFPFL